MKKILYILSLVLVAMVVLLVLQAFGLLEASTTRVVESRLGKWTILVNDTDVTSQTVDFSIDTINYDTSSKVKSGKIAPGLGGYFDIEIDPVDTEVSIRYDLAFDLSTIEDSEAAIVLSSVTELGGKTLTLTDENTYTGIITLSDIDNGNVDTIRARINWNNVEAKNDKDYELGKTADSVLEIPVQLKLTQYTGEQIEEYEGE